MSYIFISLIIYKHDDKQHKTDVYYFIQEKHKIYSNDVNFMTKEPYKVLRSKFVSGKKIYNAMCEFFSFSP